MPLSDDDVREILRLIDESDVEELRVEIEGLSLYVFRERATASRGDDRLGGEATLEAAPTLERPAEARPTDALQPIPAPMIGTFYRAAAPGATPFVDVGTHVEEDTIVCLIEVMKMMNAVPAGVVGTIVEVCAVNAELVDSGEPLFRVRPQS